MIGHMLQYRLYWRDEVILWVADKPLCYWKMKQLSSTHPRKYFKIELLTKN